MNTNEKEEEEFLMPVAVFAVFSAFLGGRWRLLLPMLGMAALLGITALQGCDAGDDYSLIDVPLDVVATIAVADTALPFTQNIDVDISAHSVFKDYGSRMKSASLSNLALQLSSYTGSPKADSLRFAAVECRLQFDSAYKDATEYLVGSFDTVKVKDLLATTHTISVSNAQLQALMNNISERPKFRLILRYLLEKGESGEIKTMQGRLVLSLLMKAAVI